MIITDKQNKMKPIELHMACYGKGVFSFHKEHERCDNEIELTIKGQNYIIHYCQACFQAQVNYADIGYMTTLMYHILVNSGMFAPIKINIFKNKHGERCIQITNTADFQYCRRGRGDYEFIRDCEKKGYELILATPWNYYYFK